METQHIFEHPAWDSQLYGASADFLVAHKKWLKIRGCNHRLTNCPCGFLVCNGENSYDKNIKYAMRMAGGGAYDISG